MLDVDGFAVVGAYHCHGMIAVLELCRARAGLFFHNVGSGKGFGVHGHESSHAVAAVNVEQLTGRAHAVSGIHVAAVLLVVFQTPVVPVFRPERLQIMDICAFHMDQIAEQAVLCHVESVHFKEVVHAVFQHHAMLAGFLGSVDQVPDLFQSHGCGNSMATCLPFSMA